MLQPARVDNWGTNFQPKSCITFNSKYNAYKVCQVALCFILRPCQGGAKVLIYKGNATARVDDWGTDLQPKSCITFNSKYNACRVCQVALCFILRPCQGGAKVLIYKGNATSRVDDWGTDLQPKSCITFNSKYNAYRVCQVALWFILRPCQGGGKVLIYKGDATARVDD